MNSTSLASSNKHGNLKRSLSRLASVQALYQITLLSEEPDNIIDNYLKNYLKVISSYENESNFDEMVYFDKMDHKFFNKLTKGTWAGIFIPFKKIELAEIAYKWAIRYLRISGLKIILFRTPLEGNRCIH